MTKKKILVIEDATLWRTALEGYFTEEGYRVYACDDGMLAIELVQAERPDVVIMDYLLPRIDGGRICEFIKQSPEFQEMITIILTGAVIGGLRRESLNAADAVIAKGPLSLTLKTCLTTMQDLMNRNSISNYQQQVIQPKELTPREMTLKVLKLKEYIDSLQSRLADAIFEIDDRLKIVRINPAASKFIGRQESAILGMNIHDILAIPPGSVLSEALLEAFHQEKDFNPGPFEHQYGHYFFESTISRIPYVFGKLGAVLISRDITQRKKAEQTIREADEKLRQAQKLEAIGRFAGGLAHDLSNIMTVISGNTEILGLQAKLEERGKKNLEDIQYAVSRAIDLIKNLLTFARRQVTHPKLININKSIADMENMFRRLLEEDIDFRINYGANLGFIKIDPSNFEQILLNLIINARDAMPDGGRLTIETATSEPGQGESLIPLDSEETGFLKLSVTDTGSGIPSDIQSKIYDPFFTTKKEGKGVGLGLAIVHNIVAEYKGSIEVRTELGKGTTFTVLLPISDDQTNVLDTSTEAHQLMQGDETIILVDDDVHVRRVLAYFMTIMGYTVIEFGSGPDALAFARENRGKTVDLLITDIIMPRLNGIHLAIRLREIYPELKIIFITGYTDLDISQRAELPPGIPIVSKPVQAATLMQSVRTVLDTDFPTMIDP